jgi:hypothetical protein
MGPVNSIPVISQIKSLAQVIEGHPEEAKKTQDDFSKQCVVVSQCRSLVHSIAGDNEQAKKVQEEYLNVAKSTFNGAVNSMPIVGNHLKEGIYYLAGDNENGDNAMKNVSRTTAVIGGAIGGFLLGSVPGAVIGAMSSGVGADIVITAVDSNVHKESRPYGHIPNLIAAKENKDYGGLIFDSAFGLLTDGFKGYAIGTALSLDSISQLNQFMLKKKGFHYLLPDVTKDNYLKKAYALMQLENLMRKNKIAHRYVKPSNFNYFQDQKKINLINIVDLPRFISNRNVWTYGNIANSYTLPSSIVNEGTNLLGFKWAHSYIGRVNSSIINYAAMDKSFMSKYSKTFTSYQSKPYAMNYTYMIKYSQPCTSLFKTFETK